MPTTIHHIAFSAADLNRSSTVYDAMLAELGYQRSGGLGSPLVYVGDGPDVLVYAAEGGQAGPHRHGRPGLQHVAFQVDRREQVDAAYRAAVSAGATIVHEPSSYDYMPGYYAVFLEDPDGSRIEVVHIPVGAV